MVSENLRKQEVAQGGAGGASGAIRDLVVVICTRNRRESLRVVLESVDASARRAPELRVGVWVVDNNGNDGTPEMLASFQGAIQVRTLTEQRPGKAYGLNTALEAMGTSRADVVAFLDDDITVAPDWVQGVAEICRRHPECDIFTGNSHVVWPQEEVPEWMKAPRMPGWAFSVADRGAQDRALGPGEWATGGHFWLRGRVLATGIRFGLPLSEEFGPTGYVSDPDFQLQLQAVGLRGMSGPDARVGHRIQAGLTDYHSLRRRAAVVGRSVPYIRSTYPTLFRRAWLLARFPRLYRIAHLGRLGVAGLRCVAICLVPVAGLRRPWLLEGVMQWHNNLEAVRHTARIQRRLRDNAEKVDGLRSRWRATRSGQA
ncbi:MAG: glycosyltransferase family 2 protein [Verrucomicrobia bacterium]|nr:glycosyltransferase family 2 protein [Verrucomicrobiota bacterium]